jgi:DNA ligase-1
MKAFADLFSALDQTNKTGEKIDAMVRYFRSAPPADAAWAIFFLSGRKPKAVVQVPRLCLWAVEAAGLPPWLFDESYDAVGDVAETIALLLPVSNVIELHPLHEMVERLYSLRRCNEEKQRQIVIDTWRQMDATQRFVWNKLITGAFRVGVSQQLVARALAEVSGLTVEVISHRLMGNWDATAEFYTALISEDTKDADISRPYPFCLAYPLEGEPEDLGDVRDWSAEWKWDGIRSQLIKRDGQLFLWSRGEELITERFPEISEAAKFLPDGTAIDGEVLAWRDGAVLDFGQLQLRIGRKVVGKKLLTDVPVILMAYDLLELAGQDVREQPFAWRRSHLESLLTNAFSADRIQLSPIVTGASWSDLQQSRSQSRAFNVEGLILKKLQSPYRVGRQKGDWWKWKIDPYTVDAVLIYAQRGSGKRASLYTDYTFGVWDHDQLVPIAKAYSGLTDAEIAQVDSFVRRNTLDKYGPVRVVKPSLVFELGFEGLQKSTRHKSGIAVRFPRMLRWRTDKKPEDADSLDTIEAMLHAHEKRD